MKFAVLALSGPSGVGKGHLKRLLVESLPNVAALPFASTRRPRASDGDDLISGLELDAFEAHVAAGRIDLPSNPYGSEWYGIWKPALDLARQAEMLVVTEVHPSQVPAWRSSSLKPLSVVGLVASDIYLKSNLLLRGDADWQRRLAAANRERLALAAYAAQGELDDLLHIESRDEEVWAELIARVLRTL